MRATPGSSSLSAEGLGYFSLGLAATVAIAVCALGADRLPRRAPIIACVLEEQPHHAAAVRLGNQAGLSAPQLCCTDLATNGPAETNDLRGRS